MPKFISIEEAVELIPDGATIMVGGFVGCGSPDKLLKALSESGKKDFTIIANDPGCGPGYGPVDAYYGNGHLISNHCAKRLIMSHVGILPEVGQQNLEEKTLTVDLVPQGSLAEMIRAGGFGLGGVLTPTGVGTLVEESPLCLGRQTVDGKDYLLMKPLHADVALIGGTKCDKNGNVWYKGTTRNFNTVIANAADIVICEPEEVVEVGEIEPENVHVYGICVNYVCK